ncbi:MAG: hypothetical protein PHC51_06795 [bacterium]|nr:hypothetical protein [bacterium]
MQGGDIIIGGSFSDINSVFGTKNIARWDGSNWHALGAGIDGRISDMVVSGGNLIVGGQFKDGAGNLNADNVAVWDGASWLALGPGIAGLTAEVRSVVLLGGNIVVGGSFNDAGGDVNADNIAVWNGAAWSGLGTGLNSRVYTLAVLGSDLYAGGSFSNAGGDLSADYIARWDGGAWHALGGSVDYYVEALAVSGSDLYVGGLFWDAGGVAGTNNIARWDGSSWYSLGDGVDDEVFAIAVSGTDVYVGGYFYEASYVPDTSGIARWDGNAWHALGKGLDNAVNSILVNGEDVYAAGEFNFSADYQKRLGHFAWYAWTAAADLEDSSLVSSAVDSIGDLHLLYSNGADDLVYRRYDSNITSWQSTVTLQSGTAVDSLGLAIGNSDSAHALWLSGNVIAGKSADSPYESADWSMTAATLYSVGNNRGLSVASSAVSNRIPYYWVRGTGAPYSVMAGSVSGDIASATVSISGVFTINGSPFAGAVIDGGLLGTVITAADGSYNFGSVVTGTNYQLTPILSGYRFEPGSVSGTASGDAIYDFFVLPHVTSPAYGFWNSYLGTINILELMNTGSLGLSAVVELYGMDGGLLSSKTVWVPGYSERDVVVNDQDGFIVDSYGTVKVTSSRSHFDGRISKYRPSGGSSSSQGSFGFVYAEELSNGLRGSGGVVFNTYHPDNDAAVYNFLTLMNPAGSSKAFTLKRYDMTGTIVDERRVILEADSRLDLEAGHVVPGANRVGTQMIIPDDDLSNYVATLTRYAEGESAGEFDYAFSLPAGSGESRTISAITYRDSEESFSYLELANFLNEDVTIDVELLNDSGVTLRTLNVVLSAYSQQHFLLPLVVGNSGYMRVTPDKENSIIAEIASYSRRGVDTKTAAVSVGHEASSTSQFASYNTFLQTENMLWLRNIGGANENVSWRYHDVYEGTSIPHSLTLQDGFQNVEILDGLPSNSYGLVEITSTIPGAIAAEVVRQRQDLTGMPESVVVVGVK